MKKINLNDGLSIYCLKETEAIVLDDHIKGYLKHGIKLKNNDTVIDIGANIGVLGLRLSKEFPKIKIHAFEPIPEIFSVLKKNTILSNNDNFCSYMKGISNKKDYLSFTYYPNSPALSTSKPEIWNEKKVSLSDAVRGNISSAAKNFWWAKYIPKWLSPLIAKYLKANSKIIKSKVICLSDFIDEKNINQINLLKIDCEGEELNVLQGIKKKHWDLINNIVMEIFDVDDNLLNAKNILSKHGFKKIILEKEKGFEKTKMVNIFALKE
ncbi:MAG: hypothetical protein CMP65_00905 [Flavobacteriales bacterium]|nr:hypothetical protein [Flavobacteriales bacterium]|tara:strand:+ start:3531 stop:4331 length:801 start_codon:yes stop_codon:yes gene_type:complete